jgi:hypothetical protein
MNRRAFFIRVDYSDAELQIERKDADFAMRIQLWILIIGIGLIFIVPLITGLVAFIREDWPKRRKRV